MRDREQSFGRFGVQPRRVYGQAALPRISDLAATNRGVLTWSKPAGSDASTVYLVFRDGLLVHSGTDVATWTDTSQELGAVYSYEVRTRKTNGLTSSPSNAATSSPSLVDDVLGFWDFADNLNDSSAYGRNLATNNGTAAYTTGRNGGKALIGGGGAFVGATVAANNNLGAISGGRLFFAWYQHVASSGSNDFYAQTTSGSGNSASFGFNTGAGQFRNFALARNGNYTYGSNTYYANVWQFIGLKVYNGAASLCRTTMADPTQRWAFGEFPIPSFSAVDVSGETTPLFATGVQPSNKLDQLGAIDLSRVPSRSHADVAKFLWNFSSGRTLAQLSLWGQLPPVMDSASISGSIGSSFNLNALKLTNNGRDVTGFRVTLTKGAAVYEVGTFPVGNSTTQRIDNLVVSAAGIATLERGEWVPRFYAINSNGESDPFVGSSVIVCDAPAAITDLSVVFNSGADRFEMTWTYPASNGGSTNEPQVTVSFRGLDGDEYDGMGWDVAQGPVGTSGSYNFDLSSMGDGSGTIYEFWLEGANDMWSGVGSNRVIMEKVGGVWSPQT